MTTENNMLSDKRLDKLISRKVIDLYIRIGIISFLVIRCYQFFKPFINMMLLAVILAVTLYPVYTMLLPKMGGKTGRTASTLVIAILISFIIPSTLLAFSFADSITELVTQIKNGTLQIPAPPNSVSNLPLIGEKLYSIWSSAHLDLGSVVTDYEPKIAVVTKQLLLYAASAGSGVLLFIVSLILAGIWMAYAPSAHAAVNTIANRIVGNEKGESLITLSIATIRAVAQGVVGIACVQSILLGIGFILVDIPAAGLWALLILLLGIMQIPALLISLPIVIYVFSTNDSITIAVMFAVYTVIAGSVDNILKPLLLGRGVNAPMPVVLLGALGGLASNGILGMFQGSVLLTLGYQLFMAWVQGKHEVD